MKRFPKTVYVGSAVLFRIAKDILQARTPNGKVRDQDVGSIIGLDPGTTSNWKKGKVSVHDVVKIYQLCKITGIALEDAVNILLGNLPFEYRDYCRHASLIEGRQRRTRYAEVVND